MENKCIYCGAEIEAGSKFCNHCGKKQVVKYKMSFENKGFFNHLMQSLLGKPKVSQVHLEEFGNFIWKQIDGIQNVSQISEMVHEKFGQNAEPLIPRLVQYFKILENNSFVVRKA